MNKKQFKTIFADVLLPLGYTGVKDMFFRKIGEVFLIVELQKSSYGGRFFVNLGFFVDEGANLVRPPPYPQTHIIQQLTVIVPQSVRDTLAPALKLEVAMKAEERSALIVKALQQYGLPYLDTFSIFEKITDRIQPGRPDMPLVSRALWEIISRRTGITFPFLSPQGSILNNDAAP